MKNTKIINLYGIGCSGKTTLALEMTSWLKKENQSVEYVPEWIKPFWYDKNEEGKVHYIPNQLLTTGSQMEAIMKLMGKVDFIVTDSPPLLGALYSQRTTLKQAIECETYDLYTNHINILLEPLPFKAEGRGTGSNRHKTYTNLLHLLNDNIGSHRYIKGLGVNLERYKALLRTYFSTDAD